MNLYLKIGLILLLLAIGSYIFLVTQNKDSSGFLTVINEAFLRVPLPPMPEATDNTEAQQINNNVSSTSIKRELFGIKTVTEAVNDPTTECHTNSVDVYECYANYLTYITEQLGIEEAFIKMKSLYNAGDAYAVSQCHQLTHIIGRTAATKFPIIAEAYNYGDTLCWSGYYHGVMEAIIAEIGLENIPNKLNEICAELPGKETYSFNYFNCVHGLGHGTMYVSGHELFDALELCDILTDFWERESCYGGVFMENVIANNVDHVSNHLKSDDLLYPCNAVGHQYKNQCYLMQTSYMLHETGYNFATVFELCGFVEDKFKETCYQSLGRDVSGSTLSNPEDSKNICLSGPNELSQENCIEGAAKDFISYFHSDVEAKEMCGLLPGHMQERCLKTVKNYYATF